MQISNQARWYLNGRWPVSSEIVQGNRKVEEKAMQELVDAGFATKITYWHLTAKGVEEKLNGTKKA